MESQMTGSVYGYVRVSTDKQADDGESLTVQQRQIEGWCLAHNHQLTQMFVESAVSGGKLFTERPQASLLVAQLKRGDIIVAPKLDRYFRSLRDAANIVDDMHKAGIHMWTLDYGEITGEGLTQAMMGIAAIFAALERHYIKERIRNVKQDQKARSRYLGGSVPFGYRVDAHRGLVSHAGEQLVISDLKRHAQTKSIRKARLAVIEQHGVRMSLATAAKIIAE